MSRQLLFALGLLLSVLAAPGRADAKKSDHEPAAIAGRSLAAWQKDLDSDDLLVREEAIEVLASAGPKAKEAVPALNKLLEHDNRTLRARAAIALWKIGSEPKSVVGVLGDSLAEATVLVRRDSASALAQMGPAAAPAAPGLIQMLDDADYSARVLAQNALSRIERAAMPALMTALKSKEVRLRRNAASHLVMYAYQVRTEDLDAVEVALKDEDGRVRGEAARLLWYKGRSDKSVIDGLTAAMTDGDDNTKYNVLNSIQSSSVRSKALIPLLETALKVAPGQAKSLAVRILYQIEKKPEKVLPFYTEQLRDSNRTSWSNTLLALGDLGEDAKPLIPRLVEMMKARDFYNTYEIRQAMSRMGEPAIASMVELLKDTTSTNNYAPLQENAIFILAQLGDKAVKAVTPLLDDKRTIVRVSAVRVLGQTARPPRESVAKLTELLDDRETTIREQAAVALGNTGSDAEKAIPKLAELAKDKNHAPRIAALHALVKVSAPAKVVTPLALEGLKTTHPAIKLASLEVLALADPKHEELLDHIRALMKDNNSRYGALQVLARLGADAAKAVPDLIKQLDDPNNYNRRHAIDVLAQLGPVAKESGPALAELLSNSDQSIQAATLNALTRITPEAKTVVPKLIAYIEDPKTQASYTLTAAINVVGTLGPKASDAGPALMKLLKDQTQQPYNRSSAGLALALVDPQGAKKEMATLRALSKASPDNFVLIRAILLADPKDKDAIAALESGLKSNQQYTRSSAVGVITTMGKEAKPFADLLRPLLKDSYSYTRAMCALALFRATGDAKEALPTLEELLQNTKEPFARGYAAHSLGEMGAAAKPAWKALVVLRREQEQYTRQQVETAMKKIDLTEATKLGVR